MTLDPIALFGPPAVALAVLLMMATQGLKEGLNLTGWRAKTASVLLGLLLGLFGLRQTAAKLLPDAPPVIGGLILGLFLAFISMGGYNLITWLQDRLVLKKQESGPDTVVIPIPTTDVATPPEAPAPGGYPDDDPRSGIHPLLSTPTEDYATLRNG